MKWREKEEEDEDEDEDEDEGEEEERTNERTNERTKSSYNFLVVFHCDGQKNDPLPHILVNTERKLYLRKHPPLRHTHNYALV